MTTLFSAPLSDVTLEVVRALVMLGIVAILLWLSHRQHLWHERGWGFILAGFALVAFAGLIDITDEYESLKRFEVIGDTTIQGILEKVVGFLVGFSLLAIGFLRWLPHIAARRQAERERVEKGRDAQIAKETTHALERFVATMSHEIRTPMHGVIGMTDLLLRTDLDAEQRKWITVVHDSAQALVEVINDTLDLSRIEAGKLETETVDFDFATTVHECAALFAAEVKDKGLEMSVSLDPAIPPVLRGDARSVRQVLLNLVSNAAKFTASGKIAVLAQLEDSQGSSERIRLTVSDTGAGIPPCAQREIFEPFTRANRGASNHRGSGLGLAISKRLVGMMGGEIGLESKSGRGSTFWFTVELEHARSTAAERAGRSDDGSSAREPLGGALPAPASATVLLVEDDDTSRFITLKMLEQLDCPAEAVRTGREAIDAVEQRDYGLVLMDCLLPDMHGCDATRVIRSTATGQARHIPIVALTASALQETRDACLACGMNAYMAKPVTLEHLRSVLSRWLPLDGSPEPLTENRADSAAALPEKRPEPVDADTLRRLADELGDGGGGAVRALVGAYLAELPQRRASIERGLADGDSRTVYRVAHTLKSTSATLGATALAELCEKLESAAHSGDLSLAEASLERFGGECDRVAAALESRLSVIGARSAR